jgi:cell division protein FtsQ
MGLLLAIAALSSLMIYSFSVLISRPYFEIKEISVRGLKELTEKDVLASAEIKPAQNLLAINIDAVIRRVAANQWVKNVYIGRELPNKLVLEVQERSPLVLVKQGSDFYLMDGEGFVFKKLGKSDQVDLPVLTGFNVQDKTKTPLFLSMLDLLKTISSSSHYAYLGTISEIHIDDVFGLSLISGTGLYVKLGIGGFESKLKKLTLVLADLEQRGMKNGYLCIDLSDESKVTVQRKNAPGRIEQGNKGKQYLI